jgi:hypothetical protein
LSGTEKSNINSGNWQNLEWVHIAARDTHLKVPVWTGGVARIPRETNELALFDLRTAVHADLGKVRVQRLVTVAMIDQDSVSIPQAGSAGKHHESSVGRVDGTARRRSQVEAMMALPESAPG